MTEIIVIGAGIAGSSVTRALRARGRKVVLVASPDTPPASLAALCVTRNTWYTGAQKEAQGRSVELYREWGALRGTEGVASTWRKPEPRPQAGWLAIDPIAPLLAPDVEARVTGISSPANGFRAKVQVEMGETLTADTVIVAAGPASWPLLGLEPPKTTWGATGLGDPGTLSSPLRAHLIRPRHHVLGVDLGPEVRVGSSTAQDPATARGRLGHMVEVALGAGMMSDGPRRIVVAQRAMGEAAPRQLAPHLWLMAGYGRVGYSLAPAHGEALACRL